MKITITTILLTLNFLVKAQCYQEIVNPESEMSLSSRKVGFIGEFQGKNLFYEILSTNNGGGTAINIIFIKSDTMVIADYDICLDITESSIEVSKIHSEEAEYINEPIYTIDSIKSISQILKHTINYGRLTSQDTKVYLKDKVLILEYITGSCITNCPAYLVKEKYKMENRKFKYVNQIQKEIK